MSSAHSKLFSLTEKSSAFPCDHYVPTLGSFYLLLCTALYEEGGFFLRVDRKLNSRYQSISFDRACRNDILFCSLRHAWVHVRGVFAGVACVGACALSNFRHVRRWLLEFQGEKTQ
ncbi:hypothetical protein BaRGS_00040356, partial [Batillaria attramentaria]